MKIFLIGSDNIGWSIDEDRRYTEIFLARLDCYITTNPLIADVIHSVWWNSLLGFRYFPLRWKKNIAVVTNEINIYDPNFRKAKTFVNLWLAPSWQMYKKLKSAEVDVMYQPFYVNEEIFVNLKQNKQEIANELGINYDFLVDKLVIGSFQRDSLGKELSKPKWQKNPELLINILCRLPKSKFVLLLAGPRRHWIIDQCKKLGIPYLYYGKEPVDWNDDIYLNTLEKQTINKLYNLTDIYIISSKSEGGPKAVLESAFTKTMVLSTNVGLAPDFLNSWCIYGTAEGAKQKIQEIMEGKDVSEFVEFNYEKAYNVASYQQTLDRWREIYDYFADTYIV